MKNKLFLLLTFVLSFIIFCGNTKAMKYEYNKSYSCDISGYSLVYSDDQTNVYCCPTGYEAHSDGCYLPMSGAARKIKDDCESRGTEYINSGTQKYCKVDFKEPVVTGTRIPAGNDDDEDTGLVGTTGTTSYEFGREYYCTENDNIIVVDDTRNEVYCCPRGFSGSNGKCVAKRRILKNFFTFNAMCDSFNGTLDASYCYVNPIVPALAKTSTCEDLLDHDLKDLINEIMGWIRIAAPILLIAFGTIDFVKATFSGKEEDMKKHRQRFIKRIVAAVLLFLIPIFVNLFLDLVNQVWSWVSPETCIK